MTTSGARVVAVWRDVWLPFSETFIRDQIANYRKWTAFRVGFAALDEPLVTPDYAPGGLSAVERLNRRLFGLTWHRRAYERRLHEAEALLIHAHFGPGGLSAMPLSAALGLPLVTTFHGQDAFRLGGRYPLLNRRYAAMLPKLFQESETLVAVSTFNADRLVNAGAPASMIEVIRTGTAVPISPPDEPRNGVLFVGRLIAQKGAHILLSAVSRLPASLRQTRITIAGDGPELPHLRRLADDLSLRVDFVGVLDHVDVVHAMRSSAVFCGPSIEPEGFGMVYAEAAAAATPAIAFDHGGAREAIQHGLTGLLVEPGDVDALASALEVVLSDEGAARQMGLGGHALARVEFNVQKQSGEVERLYSSLVGL